jgi:hypothetical protein
MQYRCQENGLQLRALTMTFPPTEHDEDGKEYDLPTVE